jgi:hypothetical protein
MVKIKKTSSEIKRAEFIKWAEETLKIRYKLREQSILLHGVWRLDIVPLHKMPKTNSREFIHIGWTYFDVKNNGEILTTDTLCNAGILICDVIFKTQPLEYCKQVFLHELCHALQVMYMASKHERASYFDVMGHDEVFRHFCNLLGVEKSAGEHFNENIGFLPMNKWTDPVPLHG